MLGSSLEYVDVREEGVLTVGHVGHADCVLNLTKDDISRILQGWPPFYRKSFESAEGQLLDSPLTSYDFIRRPGWIIAIGLGRVQPTDVYVSTGITGQPDMFAFAIGRVRMVLQTKFEAEWPQDVELRKSVDKITHMMGAGPSVEFKARRTTETAAYPLQVTPLAKDQCDALMHVFNNMEITAAEKLTLDPVLKAALERVETGVAVALRYATSHRAMTVPPLLQGDKIVYLRNCVVDGGNI